MKTKRWSIFDIALIGLLIALTIVASRYLKIEPTPWLRLTFSNAFIMLAGIWLGPIAGALVGGISDLLGCLISGYAPSIPYMIAPITTGVLAGICAPLFRKNKNVFIYGGILAGIALITTVLIGSWAMNLYYGTPYAILIPQRGLQAILNTVLNTVVVYSLYRSPVTGMLNSQTVQQKKVAEKID